jgi:hypothetical protein
MIILQGIDVVEITDGPSFLVWLTTMTQLWFGGYLVRYAFKRWQHFRQCSKGDIHFEQASQGLHIWDNTDDLVTVCHNSLPSGKAQVVLAGIQGLATAPLDLRSGMTASNAKALSESKCRSTDLESFLWRGRLGIRKVGYSWSEGINFLAAVSTSILMFSFFTTALEWVKIFNDISQHPDDTYIYATAFAITEVLIPTSLGLLVTIPAFVLYRHLRRRTESYLVELEGYLLDLVNRINRA